MKKLFQKISSSLILCLLVLSSFFMTFQFASAEVDKKFSEPEDLGAQIRSVAIYDSTYGKEDGRDVMYTTASGAPAIFQVIDLVSQEVLRTYSLEGSGSSWSHITVPNGNVYIGGDGELYEYSPETKEVVNLGGIGESVVYGLSYDEEGRVYFGSFPNAKAGRYDPNTGEMKDYGSVAPGQDYSRSTAYHDGYLYLGIGIHGYLVKLNVETGESEKIELPSTAINGSTNIWQLDAAGKYIIAGIGGGNNALLFYDTETGEWSDTYYTGNKGLRIVHGKPGSNNVYYLQNNILKEVDLTTLNATDTGVRFGTFLRNTRWVEMPNDSDLPGLSLVTVQFGGAVSFLNLETKKVKSTKYPIVGNPIPIQALEKANDGKLYMSGYPGGTASSYDPATGVTESFTLAQSEGMAAIGDKLYFGIYPSALIFELDTTKPLSDTSRLKQIYDIQNEDRPFIMTPVQEKLFIGTIPGYGVLGGGLTVLDPTNLGNTKVFSNVINNQSIAGLAEKDGKLYGSTTVAGGLGIVPTEEAAKIFVWDIATEKVVKEFVPQIPGVTVQPKLISGMKLGPDGLLWSATDGTIFAMDPETLEIVKSKNIYPEVTDYGRWRPVHIRWSDDGLMYTTLAGKLTVIDPASLEYETLSSTELMTLGDDGAIYYSKGASLMKIEVSEKITHEKTLEVVYQHRESGNLSHSLSQILINSINQSIHHRDNDRLEQSQKHLDEALKHLEKAKSTDVTPDAYNEIKELLSTIDY
jgi:hypothetical protein